MAGDDQWGTLHLDGGGVEERSIDLTLGEGAHEIQLVYDNDGVVPGVCDRNLHAEALRFDPVPRAAPAGGASREIGERRR